MVVATEFIEEFSAPCLVIVLQSDSNDQLCRWMGFFSDMTKRSALPGSSIIMWRIVMCAT